MRLGIAGSMAMAECAPGNDISNASFVQSLEQSAGKSVPVTVIQNLAFNDEFNVAIGLLSEGDVIEVLKKDDIGLLDFTTFQVKVIAQPGDPVFGYINVPKFRCAPTG